jgi:hypothetical protein
LHESRILSVEPAPLSSVIPKLQTEPIRDAPRKLKVEPPGKQPRLDKRAPTKMRPNNDELLPVLMASRKLRHELHLRTSALDIEHPENITSRKDIAEPKTDISKIDTSLELRTLLKELKV